MVAAASRSRIGQKGTPPLHSLALVWPGVLSVAALGGWPTQGNAWRRALELVTPAQGNALCDFLVLETVALANA